MRRGRCDYNVRRAVVFLLPGPLILVWGTASDGEDSRVDGEWQFWVST
ncbi:hypothetical protein TIFTF001_002334 [Ficus carica]|uniref:Uncharacterized protein n=1 Tax=Ficus carica TaxID=3494 RepID=A0AA87Z5E8_FICCA|nr:hypothetical protein TIFTF001_002334 [Ficus carica]